MSAVIYNTRLERVGLQRLAAANVKKWLVGEIDLLYVPIYRFAYALGKDECGPLAELNRLSLRLIRKHVEQNATDSDQRESLLSFEVEGRQDGAAGRAPRVRMTAAPSALT
jgi:hypothetical protein